MRQDMHDIGQVLSFQGNGAGGTGILVIGHEQAILQETAGIQNQDRGVRHDFQGPARTGITQNTCLFRGRVRRMERMERNGSGLFRRNAWL